MKLNTEMSYEEIETFLKTINDFFEADFEKKHRSNLQNFEDTLILINKCEADKEKIYSTDLKERYISDVKTYVYSLKEIKFFLQKKGVTEDSIDKLINETKARKNFSEIPVLANIRSIYNLVFERGFLYHNFKCFERVHSLLDRVNSLKSSYSQSKNKLLIAV